MFVGVVPDCCGHSQWNADFCGKHTCQSIYSGDEKTGSGGYGAVGGFILLLPSPLSGGQAVEAAAVAYSADESAFVSNSLQEQDGITTLETTAAEEGADLDLAEQDSLLSVLWPKQTWEKRQRQYQAWGLLELGDGSAQWQGKPVYQLLDCDGSYAYYESGAETAFVPVCKTQFVWTDR